MISDELLEKLVCPKCIGELEYSADDQKLICYNCRLKYEIREDIPIMLPEEAESF